MTAALLPPAIAELVDLTPPFSHTTADDAWGYDFDAYAMPTDALVRLVQPRPLADRAVWHPRCEGSAEALELINRQRAVTS